MSKRVQDEKPPMLPEAEAWHQEEIQAQNVRYRGIVEEIDALEPEREKWIEEFLSIIQTKGFNMTGDTRRKIGKQEIAEKPDRPDAMRVIW